MIVKIAENLVDKFLDIIPVHKILLTQNTAYTKYL